VYSFICIFCICSGLAAFIHLIYFVVSVVVVVVVAVVDSGAGAGGGGGGDSGVYTPCLKKICASVIFE